MQLFLYSSLEEALASLTALYTIMKSRGAIPADGTNTVCVVGLFHALLQIQNKHNAVVNQMRVLLNTGEGGGGVGDRALRYFLGTKWMNLAQGSVLMGGETDPNFEAE